MRLRNDTGSVLDAFGLGRSIGPGEEFEHDVEALGVVPGCVPADAPEAGDGTGPEDEPDPPAKPSRAKAAAKAKEDGA